jgi:hypothetical protein
MYFLPGGNSMNLSKYYRFRSSPEECLDSATSYLADKGYRIETRTENEVSMFRRSITPEWVLVVFIISLFTFGAPLLGLLALFFYKRRIAVVARPLRGGASLVMLTWSNEMAKRNLETWFEAEWSEDARPWRLGASRWSYIPYTTLSLSPPLHSDYVPSRLDTETIMGRTPPRSRASLGGTSTHP